MYCYPLCTLGEPSLSLSLSFSNPKLSGRSGERTTRRAESRRERQRGKERDKERERTGGTLCFQSWVTEHAYSVCGMTHCRAFTHRSTHAKSPIKRGPHLRHTHSLLSLFKFAVALIRLCKRKKTRKRYQHPLKTISFASVYILAQGKWERCLKVLILTGTFVDFRGLDLLLMFAIK